jgi:hypothetical protein
MGANWLRDVKSDPGLQAWRFDGKSEEISLVPKGNLGVFRSDDCYVLSRVSMGADSEKPEFLILFWIGSSAKNEASTQQKVEDLEKKLAGQEGPVRVSVERQGSESEEFRELFLFRGGAMYIDPITLKRQQNLREDVHRKALYMIKGKKFARVKRVAVSYESLNSGDVFILDNDETIYTWTGKKANRMEKGRSLDLGKRLRDERMNRCKAEIVLEEEGKESDAFWEVIGGKGEIASPESAGPDEAFEMASVNEETLYRVGLDPSPGADKVVSIDKVERADILHRALLEHECSYVLDCGTEIFVWHGSKTTGNIRQEAVVYADGLKHDKTRPDWVDVTVTANGAEPGLFKVKWKGLFEEYVDSPVKFANRLNKMNPVARVRQEKINVDALLHPEKYAAAKEEEIGNERLISNKDPNDDSDTTIYYIKNKMRVELPKEEYGFFYSENCYIMHYTIRIPGSTTRHIVYFWQGRGSSVNARGYSAMLAAELAKQTSRDCIQVRVVQNKEPEHFLSHFEGFYCVRTGKRHGWKKRQTHPTLYHVRGLNGIMAHAVQVRPHATSLCSSDVFILHERQKRLIVWYGKEANEHERKFGKEFSTRLFDGDATEEGEEIARSDISEDKDDEVFWTTLPGGKADYNRVSGLVKTPRLFICSDRSSVFKVNESLGFAQEDLNDRTVAMLDGIQEMFLWIGAEATIRERKMATETALDYILEAGRDPSTCHLYMTNSGTESYQFTSYFHGWEHELDLDDFLEQLANPTSAAPAAPQRVQAEPGLRRSLSRKNSKLSRQQSINRKTGAISRQPSQKRTVGINRQVSGRNKNQNRINASSNATSSAPASLDDNAADLAEGVTVDGIRGTRTRMLDRSPSMMLVEVQFSKRTRNINKWNPTGIVVDFDRLKVKPTPEGVDGGHLEAFLSVEEFFEMFGTTIDKFYALPIWKQLVIKKDKNMF